MRNDAWSTSQIRKVLIDHDTSLGGRVVAFFFVGSVTCFELDNGFLVGGQVAKEHHQIEIVLGRQLTMPIEFRESREPGPLGMEVLLVGRKFRGVIGHKESGDVSFDFGRYRLRIDRARSGITIDVGTDRRELHDLPEDEHLPIADQFRRARELNSRNDPVV